MGRRKNPPAAQGEQPEPRPGHPVFARIDEDLWADLSRFLKAQRLRPTLTTVIETALRDFLRAEGFLTQKPKEGDDR